MLGNQFAERNFQNSIEGSGCRRGRKEILGWVRTNFVIFVQIGSSWRDFAKNTFLFYIIKRKALWLLSQGQALKYDALVLEFLGFHYWNHYFRLHFLRISTLRKSGNQDSRDSLFVFERTVYIFNSKLVNISGARRVKIWKEKNWRTLKFFSV